MYWSAVVNAALSRYATRSGSRRKAIDAAYSNRPNGRSDRVAGLDYGSFGNVSIRRVRPPRMYALERGVQAQLFYRHPKFFVRAYKGRLEAQAQDLERVLNTVWPRVVGSKELRWCITDAFKYGRGWGMVGFEFDEEVERRKTNQRMRAARKMKTDPMLASMTPDQVEELNSAVLADKENEAEPETFEGDALSRTRKISFRRVPPMDVSYDMDARCMDDVRWIDRRMFIPKNVLEADPFLSNAGKVRADWSHGDEGWTNRRGTGGRATNTPSPALDEFGNFTGPPEQYKYACIHETFVKREDGTWDMLVYADGHNFFLRKLKAPYWFGCPYVSLAWNDDGESLDVVADAEHLLPGVIEEAEVRSRLRDHWLRKANDVNLIDDRLIENPKNRATLEIQKTGSFLPVKNPSADGVAGQALGNYITPVPRNSALGEIYQHLQIIREDYEAVVGLGPNQQLRALKSETSGTEAAEIRDQARARGIEKQEALEDFTLDTAKKIVYCIAQFFDAERLAEVAAPDTVARWRGYEFSAGSVQDGLGIQIERGSMRPPSSDDRTQTLMMLIQMAMQNPAFAIKVNTDEAFMRVLEEKGILDGSKLINTGVDMNKVLIGMMQAQAMGMAGKGGAPPAPGKAKKQSPAGGAQS